MSPPRLLTLVLSPASEADREKLAAGLGRLLAEDSTFAVETKGATGDVVLACVTELQLELIVDRLKREFDVSAGTGRPTVLYKEALTRAATGEARYMRHTNGRDEYAHAKVHLFPGEPGSGFVFHHVLDGGVLPAAYIEAIAEGAEDARNAGVVAGCAVRDVRVELYDGSHHSTDSSTASFRLAGAMAFQDAARKAGPVLLEPVMRLDVRVPGRYATDVLIDLAVRRGRIDRHAEEGGIQEIQAVVPFAELMGYRTNLSARSRGTGTHSMRFEAYEPVPRDEDGSDDDRSAFVTAPLEPRPGLRQDGIALPEPDES
jgi:elongation factor G